jgi:hypothetical protein
MPQPPQHLLNSCQSTLPSPPSPDDPLILLLPYLPNPTPVRAPEPLRALKPKLLAELGGPRFVRAVRWPANSRFLGSVSGTLEGGRRSVRPLGQGTFDGPVVLGLGGGGTRGYCSCARGWG